MPANGMRGLISIACALALSGCGYRLSSRGSPLPEGVRAVWAPLFLNRTGEPALETLFTQAFREQLIRAGVAGGAGSEARVEGDLLSVAGAGTLTGAGGRLASYRLTATAVLKLKKGERVLAEALLTGSEDYLPGADLLHSEANRVAALHRLAAAMMKEGYERLATR